MTVAQRMNSPSLQSRRREATTGVVESRTPSYHTQAIPSSHKHGEWVDFGPQVGPNMQLNLASRFLSSPMRSKTGEVTPCQTLMRCITFSEVLGPIAPKFQLLSNINGTSSKTEKGVSFPQRTAPSRAAERDLS
ncbi:hypothetical protein PSTT_02252 [Puccinia striiformis]|uniref:Uncharacterized protein n=1 Tax=Puccinia striiformis TaxID=27350 RepID=A0A2S4W0K8_9BASI|nr:hypothetical protein PSTT_02252 [Puccinia striiformis]